VLLLQRASRVVLSRLSKTGFAPTLERRPTDYQRSERDRNAMNIPDMPEMGTQGPFSIEPATAVWTLVRELVKQQRSIAQVGQMLAAIQTEHVDSPEEVISLNYDVKNVSDLAALKWLWYSKTLPDMVAKFAVALEAHETFGDAAVTIDDPIDAAVWRSKYFAAVDDMTVTLAPNPRKADGA
jgi:hypothetical protein